MTILPIPGWRHLIATAEGPFRRWDTSRGGQVRLWDPIQTQSATGTPGAPTDGQLAGVGQNNVVAVDTLTLDGRTLLATAGDNGSIALWDTAEGRLAGGPLAPHTEANSVTAMTVATTPDGRTLIVTGSPDRRCLNVWDPATGALWELPLDVAVKALAATGPHIAVAHDGGALVVTIADQVA
jgi:WD40 repeat protein